MKNQSVTVTPRVSVVAQSASEKPTVPPKSRGTPENSFDAGYTPPGAQAVDAEAMKAVAARVVRQMSDMTFVPKTIPAIKNPTDAVATAMSQGKYTFDTLNADIQARLGISGIVKAPAGAEIVIVAADHGVWASELTLAMKAFESAGYTVRVATLSGKAPMFLPVSMNPDFVDPTWGAGWVGQGEAELGWQTQRQLLQMEKEGKIIKLDDVIPARVQAKDGVEKKREYEAKLSAGLASFKNLSGLVVPGGTGAIIDLGDNSQLEALVELTHAAGKPLVTICYGTLAALYAQDGKLIKGKSLTVHNRADDFVTGTGALTDAGVAKLRERLEANDRTAFTSSGDVWTSEWRTPTLKAEVTAEALGNVISPYTPGSCAVIDSSAVAEGKGAIVTARSVHDGYDAALLAIAQQLGKQPLAGEVMVVNDGGQAKVAEPSDYNANRDVFAQG